MTHDAAHAMLDHPTDPHLRGPVTFRLPDAYTAIAIQRRITELANGGRDPKVPLLHPMDLAREGYELCLMIATLEHVIVTAPRGLYRTIGGKAQLVPGALTEFEADEDDGAVRLLYAAYTEWRLRFRLRRAGTVAGAGEVAGSAGGGAGGEAGGAGPAAGAGDSA